MSVMNKEMAFVQAKDHVDKLADRAAESFEILQFKTQEVKQGWIFYFNTSDYVQSGNPSDALAGNGPLLVLRNGSVIELPSSLPIDEALKII